MAQATLDPLAADAAPEAAGAASAAVSSTDDLLSKLAGDEIDKLLAEAEASRAEPALAPPPPPPAAAATVEQPAAPVADTAEQLDDLISGLGPTPASASAPTEPAAPAAPPDQAAEEARLEKLAKELEVDQAAALTATATTLEELPPAAEEPQPETVHDRTPWFLWPLIWINAPLSSSPDVIRAVLGKVAVVTFINASLVLGWVALFRKHR
jgi:hypothetical protein